MKNPLLVLLPIAVTFFFLFGTAFAAGPTDEPNNVIADRNAAIAKLDAQFKAESDKLDAALGKAKTGTKNPTDATAAEWEAACDEAYIAVFEQLKGQREVAYAELTTQEQAIAKAKKDVKGYYFGTATQPSAGAEDGYVYCTPALNSINLTDANPLATTPKVTDAAVTYVVGKPIKIWNGTAFKVSGTTGINASKIMYDNALADTIKLIANYNVDQFSKNDKVDLIDNSGATAVTITKSSYEWIVAKQNAALKELRGFGEYGEAIGTTGSTYDVTAVKGVYEIQNEGTEGESYNGTFYNGITNVFPAITALKTTQITLSDAARIDYAKSQTLAGIKDAVEKQRKTELKVQNDIILAQSVSTKPNQTVIDKAKEKIEAINEKHDNELKILTARIENADYEVVNNAGTVYVNVLYKDAAYTKITNKTYLGSWGSNDQYTSGVSTSYSSSVAKVLPEAEAETILNNIAKLEKEAALLKSAIDVDGATALEIDKALADAIKAEYMVMNTGDLSYVMTDTEVHMHAHALLGEDCSEVKISGKVTVDGKSYDRVAAWTTSGYSKNNKKAVKTIIKDAKAAIKAAKTIAEADKAFLDAYTAYDAVLTKIDQQALFNYNGALYKQDEAAKAELKAYIEYKIALMDKKDLPGTTAAATANAIETYYGIIGNAAVEDFLAEVVDAASLQASIANVKSVVDALKTKDVMKAEGTDLNTEVGKLTHPVALTQEADVLALYDKVIDYKDYCTMTGYPYSLVTKENLLRNDIERLEDLKLAELNAMKKALPALSKLTLANEAAVTAFEAAQDAYNDVYGVDGTYADALLTATDYEAADEYVDKIWELKVDAVEALIAALPTSPSAAKVKEAQDALDALGFKGLCDVADKWQTKLSKFTQDVDFASNASVEALKITASSTAKKGSITVKWTVKGDASTATAYEIWKSTKKNSGFKKAFTTKDGTKRTYKNTKGLKKGTRYYYKVRAIAYDKDGTKIKSDWSNKAYRKAK